MAAADLETKRGQLKDYKHPSKKHLQSTFTSPTKDFKSSAEAEEYKNKQMVIRARQAKEQPSGSNTEHDTRKTAKASKKHTRKKSQEWDERDQEKEKITTERHLKLVEDFEKVRTHYKKLYIKALDKKIKMQNKTIQEFSQRMEQNLKLEEEKRHNQAKVKRPKSQNINDYDFLNNVEETTYYKLIKIEEKLKRKGLLSKPFSQEQFWSYAMNPNHLEDILERGELSLEDIENMNKMNWRDVNVKEEEETSHSWALTELQKPTGSNKPGRTENWVKVSLLKHGVCTPSPMIEIEVHQEEKPPPKDQKALARKGISKALSLEQKFPKVDFPPLAAYSLVFGEQEIDPEITKEKVMEEKRKQFRDDLVYCHNSMFLHALANKAATQRLMARNKDYNFDQLAEGPTIHDLLGNCLESSFASKKALKPIEAPPAVTKKVRKTPDKRKLKRRKEVASVSLPVTPEEIHRPSSQGPLPLTLDGILHECIIKESKGLSTLWVNPFQ